MESAWCKPRTQFIFIIRGLGFLSQLQPLGPEGGCAAQTMAQGPSPNLTVFGVVLWPQPHPMFTACLWLSPATTAESGSRDKTTWLSKPTKFTPWPVTEEAAECGQRPLPPLSEAGALERLLRHRPSQEAAQSSLRAGGWPCPPRPGVAVPSPREMAWPCRPGRWPPPRRV